MQTKNTQTFHCKPDGSVTTLAKKPLDLRTLGSISKERISDIRWSQFFQSHYVDIAPNPHGIPAGVVTVEKWGKVAEGLQAGCRGSYDELPSASMLLFDDYDDAVVCEVAYIESIWKGADRAK